MTNNSFPQSGLASYWNLRREGFGRNFNLIRCNTIWAYQLAYEKSGQFGGTEHTLCVTCCCLQVDSFKTKLEGTKLISTSPELNSCWQRKSTNLLMSQKSVLFCANGRMKRGWFFLHNSKSCQVINKVI